METIGNAPEGNTILPPASRVARCIPCRRWAFTYFTEDPLEMETLESMLTNISEWIYGIETCPTTGKKHLQGYVEFKEKTRPIEKIKIPQIHWEKCKGTKEQNIIYCSKEGNVRTNIKLKKKLEDPMKGLELKPWQVEILNILNQPPDTRKIHWYWESNGKVGKTTFAKHLALTRGAIVLSGKSADIKDGVRRYLEKHDEVNLAIFHYVKTQEEYISYEALESIKDGMFFSGKFESGMVLFNQPHIIILANFKPDTSKLSKDRWIIKNINEIE